MQSITPLNISPPLRSLQSTSDRSKLSPSEKPVIRQHHELSFTSSNAYKQAIVEIYESLYHFQRERTNEQEAQVTDCISKWYEFNAVFENPFIRANGVESIVNQFSLTSLIPGHIWSELGDVCESEDYDGNRVVVFFHTLHFNLLGDPTSELCSTSSYVSVPPTPHAGTPSATSKFGSFHSAILARLSLGSAVTLRHPVRVKKAGSGTTWPITWLFSHLSPRKMIADMAKFDLKLSTRLQFNEQAKIVIHEDMWGFKELLEFLAPSIWNQFYCLLRWLVGLCGNFLSRNYLRSSSRSSNSASTSSINPLYTANRIQFDESSDSLDHPNFLNSCLHSPILIGTHHHQKPMNQKANQDAIHSPCDSPSHLNPPSPVARNSNEHRPIEFKAKRAQGPNDSANSTHLHDPSHHLVAGDDDEDNNNVDDAQNTSKENRDNHLRPSGYFIPSSSST